MSGPAAPFSLAFSDDVAVPEVEDQMAKAFRPLASALRLPVYGEADHVRAAMQIFERL